ncbi:hypothetical protein GGD63_000974 [Bradyrhizobium sp. cir1]|uniref:hypothetical protein n=1 Tax=Bradyrhizobium sp. cir1 TaxID=1445730 RepID=UPI001605A988|nr:hypothetical protein [Bradyrhizobium sp. cir1]MBB4368195.1 hypothetical protein [Bradyrhizobium sp. cir1]
MPVIARPSRADLCHRFRITNLRNDAAIEALSTELGRFIAGRCADLGRAGADALGIGASTSGNLGGSLAFQI